MIKDLYDIVKGIREGYGYVGRSMLEIYSEDCGLEWEEVLRYFNENFPHKTVGGEEVWLVDSSVTFEEVEKDFEDLQ